uniref:protein INCA1 isoform X3 n=1 Tax=Panthera onca TaxID=9690 RepID=UPI002954A2D9|nr:protein INCA1 isoform X3 [Panthera onca]
MGQGCGWARARGPAGAPAPRPARPSPRRAPSRPVGAATRTRRSRPAARRPPWAWHLSAPPRDKQHMTAALAAGRGPRLPAPRPAHSTAGVPSLPARPPLPPALTSSPRGSRSGSAGSTGATFPGRGRRRRAGPERAPGGPRPSPGARAAGGGLAPRGRRQQERQRRRQRPAPARAARAGAGARGGGPAGARTRAGARAVPTPARERPGPRLKGRCPPDCGAHRARTGNRVADAERHAGHRPSGGLRRRRSRAGDTRGGWGRALEGTQAPDPRTSPPSEARPGGGAVRRAPPRGGPRPGSAPGRARRAGSAPDSSQRHPLSLPRALPGVLESRRAAATSAPMRRLGPAAQPRPVVQGEDGADDLIPFAKCSRVVSRPAPPSQSLTLMPQRYGDLFWESLSQRPSPTWTEEWHIPPSPRATGCSQPGPYPPERLPPPEVLCRRKRRRPHLAGMQQGPAGIPAQVRAVTYHLEDLRRRQRIINELKKAQWDVSGAAPEPLAPATAGCGVPSATEYPGLEEARATYPQEEGHPVTTGRTQVWPEELGGVPEGDGDGRPGPVWVAGLETHKRGQGEAMGAGALGHLARPPFPFFRSFPNFSHPYSCSGPPGAPWAWGGLVSPDDWALWPPTALSQRAGTASAPPGAWRCSLRTSPSDLPALGTGR